MRPDGRRPDQLRPLEIIPHLSEARRRLGADQARRHLGAVRRERRGRRAGVPRRQGPGLADRRVRDAAALDPHAQQARPGRPRQGDPAADRPLAARGGRPRRSSASARSRSTATCCRPTAARASSSITGAWVALRARDQEARRRRQARRHAARCCRRSPRSRSASSAARSCSTCRTSRTRKADVDMNVVGDEDGKLIEVQGTAEHGTFDRKQLDAMLDLARVGIRAARGRAAQGRCAMTPAARVRDAQPAASSSSCASCCPASPCSRVDEAAARLGRDPRGRRGRRHVRRQREQEGARGLARDRAARARRRQRPRGRRARRRARRVQRALRRRAHDDAANNAKLLAALAGVPAEQRTARFRAVLALADVARAARRPRCITADGACEGVDPRRAARHRRLRLRPAVLRARARPDVRRGWASAPRASSRTARGRCKRDQAAAARVPAGGQ